MNDIIERAKQIDGFMPEGELQLLYDLANKYIQQGSTACEIGTWKGRSAYVLASVCKEKGAKLICIDTFAGATDRAYETYKEALANPELFFKENAEKNLSEFLDIITFIKEDSQTAHTKLDNGSLDFCFIDGDHDEPAVSNDLYNYLPKMKIGGCYAGHDYFEDNRNGVKQVVDDILPDFELSHTIFFSEIKHGIMPVFSKSSFISPIEYVMKHIDDIDTKRPVKLFFEPLHRKGCVVWAVDNNRISDRDYSELFNSASTLIYSQPTFNPKHPNAHLVLLGADPEVHKKYDVEEEYDVVFVGEQEGREDILKKLDSEFNLLNLSSAENYAKELSRAKIIFNYSRYNEINMRFFEGMAVGTLVTNKVPHLPGKDGKHYMTYKDIDDAVSQIKKLLKDDKKRNEIAKNSRDFILKSHTYKHRLKEIVDIIDES